MGQPWKHLKPCALPYHSPFMLPNGLTPETPATLIHSLKRSLRASKRVNSRNDRNIAHSLNHFPSMLSGGSTSETPETIITYCLSSTGTLKAASGMQNRLHPPHRPLFLLFRTRAERPILLFSGKKTRRLRVFPFSYYQQPVPCLLRDILKMGIKKEMTLESFFTLSSVISGGSCYLTSFFIPLFLRFAWHKTLSGTFVLLTDTRDPIKFVNRYFHGIC